MSAGNTIDCPVCGKAFNIAVITEHANSCLNETYSSDQGPTSSGKRKSSEWDFFKRKNQSNLAFAKSSKKSKNCEVDEVNNLDCKRKKKEQECDNEFDGDNCIAIIDIERQPRYLSASAPKPSSLDLSTNDNKHMMRPVAAGQERTNQELKLKALNAPLADKIRPQSFEDYIGQTKAVGKKSLLHSLLLKSNSIPSMVLWGPPGCGKTTLAKILAHKCQRGGGIKFISLSATSASVGDVKELSKVAQNDLKMLRRKTILFLDEIHRFNKLQQDALLPHVENGVITLIGATTENPSFHVNSALLSRCRVISLDKLQMDDIKMIVRRACNKMGVRIQKTLETTSVSEENCNKDDESLSACKQEFYLDSNDNENPVTISIEELAIDALSGMVDGDARAALNGLQMTVQARLAEGKEGDVVISLDNVKEGLQKSHLLYDRNGEEHYNIASALIKSMRGSDDSAALYWMARMLGGGETPVFVARRLIAFASEDIGLADPTALSLAVSTFQACQLIGMPECEINLAHCVVYLSRAPKSIESFTAYRLAQECVRNHQGPLPSVPLHLRNAPTKLTKNMGYGQGYKYPPLFEGKVNQDYFPPSLVGTDFFSFMKNEKLKDETGVPCKG